TCPPLRAAGRSRASAAPASRRREQGKAPRRDGEIEAGAKQACRGPPAASRRPTPPPNQIRGRPPERPAARPVPVPCSGPLRAHLSSEPNSESATTDVGRPAAPKARKRRNRTDNAKPHA